jgi:hypothetical protein
MFPARAIAPVLTLAPRPSLLEERELQQKVTDICVRFVTRERKGGSEAGVRTIVDGQGHV